MMELEQAEMWSELNCHSRRVPDILDGEVKCKQRMPSARKPRFTKFDLAREPWSEVNRAE
jgi:hypothetical protein